MDNTGTPVTNSTTLVMGPHQQISRFLSDIFPATALGPALTGSLIIQAANPFASVGLRFTGPNFSAVASASTTPSSAPLDNQLTGCLLACPSVIFPQFAMGGGWASQLMLVETTGATATGHIYIFDPNGQPLAVTLNGQTNSTFNYPLPPGGTFTLAPRDANGQTPF